MFDFGKNKNALIIASIVIFTFGITIFLLNKRNTSNVNYEAEQTTAAPTTAAPTAAPTTAAPTTAAPTTAATTAAPTTAATTAAST